MDNIAQITSELSAGKITIPEVQRKLATHLYSAASQLETSVGASKIEAAIIELDNELELIIFTMKEENKAEAAMVTLGKAQQLLSSGFSS